MPSNEARRNLPSNECLDTFWDALWLELWSFLYSLATLVVKRMEENGRKVKKGMPKVAYRRRMAHVMHIISLRVRPKRVHKQNTLFFPTYFEVLWGARRRQETKAEQSGAVLESFGVILVPSCTLWGHFGIILGIWVLIWSHFGPFSKYIHFSNRF